MGMRVVVAIALVAAVTSGCGADPKPSDADAAPAVATSWPSPHRETPAEAGCTQDGAVYPLAASTADSEHAALDAMVVDNYPNGTRTYEVHRPVGGYGAADAGYQFVLFRNGRAAATGGVSREGDVWSAQLDGSCAERTGAITRPAQMAHSGDGRPTTLQLTCTAGGVEIATPRVRTSPHGVQVDVSDSSGLDEPFLVYGKAGRHHGGDRLSNANLSPVDLAPGTWQIGCSNHDVTDAGLRGEVTIVDPDRNWRTPALLSDCVPDGSFYAVGGQGPTEQDAIADVIKATRSTGRVRLDGTCRPV
jgi:hypothetical protein